MSLHRGLEGWGWVLLNHIQGDLWLVLGLVAKAPILGRHVSAEDCAGVP